MTDPRHPGVVERPRRELPAPRTPSPCPGQCRGVRATCTLPRSLHAPAQARTFVERQLCPRPDAETAAAVLLVTSEIVTQVVLQAEGPVTLAAECDGGSLMLQVTGWRDGDAKPGPSDRLLSSYISRSIVDGMCGDSGVEHTAQGFTLWCTIPTGCLPEASSQEQAPDRRPRRAAQGSARRDAVSGEPACTTRRSEPSTA